MFRSIASKFRTQVVDCDEQNVRLLGHRGIRLLSAGLQLNVRENHDQGKSDEARSAKQFDLLIYKCGIERHSS